MSIRSVDLQTTIAQTHHAERVNQTEHGHARSQQHQFAQQLEDVARHRQESVAETPEDENARRADEDGGQGGRREDEQERQRHEGEPAPHSDNLPDSEGLHIDVRA